MKQGHSSYYPPRASRFSPLRDLQLKLLRSIYSLPIELGILPMPLRRAALCALIPGYIYREIGYPRVFKAVLCGYVLMLIVFLAFLGYPASTIAYMLMLSAHVSSIAELIKRLSPSMGLKFRVISTVAVFLVLNSFVYGFTSGLFGRIVMPLNVDGKVVVVRVCSADAIRVGDTMAYRIESRGSYALLVKGGVGLDPVLAGPNTLLRFTSNELQINGVASPKQLWMPDHGEQFVAQDRWFVWPRISVINYNYPAEGVTSELMKIGMVSRDRVIGKPFKRWFWRKQV